MVKKILVVLALGLAAFVAFGYLQHGGPRPVSNPASKDVGGKLAYARAGALWLYQGGNQTRLTKGPADRQDKRDGQPSFSPDGTQIVYTRFDEGFSDLYVMNLSDPSHPTAITNNRPSAETGSAQYAADALWAMQPSWSPNGQRIAYTSDVKTEYPGLFSMDANGDLVRKLENLDHSTQAVENPAWSPDGTKIAVANYVTGNGVGQIWVLDTETGHWTAVTNSKDGAYDPSWSPDGEWLSFVMRDGTANNVYVVPANAEKWPGQYPTPIQLTTNGASRAPAWSPDGKKLAYIALQNTSFDLYAGDIQFDATGNPTLANVSQLTDKAGIDASSGLSWGK